MCLPAGRSARAARKELTAPDPPNPSRRGGAMPPLTNLAGSSEGAGVFLFGRGDGLEILVCGGHRWTGPIDVPLIFQLGGLQRLHRVHFMHQLVVPGPEVAGPRLEQVELGTL